MAGRINKASESYIRRSSDAKQALDKATKKLQQVIDTVSEVNKEQLDGIALTIKNKSDTYAPLDTGELIESSYIASEESSDKYTVEIGYTADHSIYTHEIGPYKNPTTPGTNYKYLERAATEMEHDILNIIKDSLENLLK